MPDHLQDWLFLKINLENEAFSRFLLLLNANITVFFATLAIKIAFRVFFILFARSVFIEIKRPLPLERSGLRHGCPTK